MSKWMHFTNIKIREARDPERQLEFYNWITSGHAAYKCWPVLKPHRVTEYSIQSQAASDFRQQSLFQIIICISSIWCHLSTVSEAGMTKSDVCLFAIPTHRAGYLSMVPRGSLMGKHETFREGAAGHSCTTNRTDQFKSQNTHSYLQVIPNKLHIRFPYQVSSDNFLWQEGRITAKIFPTL